MNHLYPNKSNKKEIYKDLFFITDERLFILLQN
ncbi:hypothetical protein OMP06_20616 (plasmid) [Acinetobacter baumannii]|nr:hypothetical protein OMP06_20616 [Acinetobacter baumannii]